MLEKLLTLLVLWALSFIGLDGCARVHSNLSKAVYEPERGGIITYAGGRNYEVSRPVAIEQAEKFCEGKGFKIISEDSYTETRVSYIATRRGHLIPRRSGVTWIDMEFVCGKAI